MIFETERLRARQARPDEQDIDLFYRLWTNPDVTRFVGFPKGIPIMREEIRDRLEKASQSALGCNLVIELKSSGQAIGECLMGALDENGVSETDVKLLPEFWGHGYGVEVKRALVDYLFEQTDCQVVQATPNIHNQASLKMQQAVGAKKVDEGIFIWPEEMQSYTMPVEFHVYQVSRQDWLKIQREK